MITGSWGSPTCWKTADPYNQSWSRNDYFDCQVKAIEAAAKLGVKSVFYVGAFPNQSPSALHDHEDIAFGGDKSFGVSSNFRRVLSTSLLTMTCFRRHATAC